MKNQILQLIDLHEKIVIHRHTRPDMDAIGSQMGLYHLIKTNYPEKEVYVVGDENNMLYNCTMDKVADDFFDRALSIIVDVAVEAMISDERYKLADDIIIIDHHQNNTDLENVTLFYQQSTYTSACEMIVDLARNFGWEITSKAATYLYGGMVTDTGRFQFINEENASRVFKNASFITYFEPKIKDLYDFLYTEELQRRKTKLMFSDFLITTNNVAYRKNDRDMVIESGLDVFGVSRGMVNLMAGIKEIPIWVSFTEDYENDCVIAEIRSRNIIVVDIAKKFGGGGHNFACGATLKDFDEADRLLEELDERAYENASFK